MFERSIHQYLEKWRNSKTRDPMVLRGARQVGKTTDLYAFAQQFEQYLYFNYESLIAAYLDDEICYAFINILKLYAP